MNREFTRRFVALITASVVVLAGCGHAPPSNPPGTKAAGDDDPWVVRGSVEAGVMVGSPPGPYSPR